MPQYKPSRRTSSRPAPPAIRRATRLLSEDISGWRKLRGLTQAQLADRSGISRDTLTRLEGGDGGVSMENMLKVLRGLGILDSVTRALDPYESEVGRLLSDRELPRRVRPINLTDRDDG
jgi:transcriptional regulator with XRE-family HTH domain